MLTPQDKDFLRQVTKEAIQEWLDQQYGKLGKWTMGALSSVALSLVGYALVIAYWKIHG